MKNFKPMGDFLRQKRREKNLSQSEVSKNLGYHVQYISNIERGIALPPLEKAKAYAKILGVNKKDMAEMYIKVREKEVRGYL